MITISYQNFRGGTNNLIVAMDWKTGELSTSLIDKEQAVYALKRKLMKRRNQSECSAANSDGN